MTNDAPFQGYAEVSMGHMKAEEKEDRPLFMSHMMVRSPKALDQGLGPALLPAGFPDPAIVDAQ